VNEHVTITRGARRAVAVLFVLMVMLAAANLFFTASEVRSSNAKWCDTIALLTSRPVPRPADPRANPSRAQAYVLYSDFVTLRHRLGCG
jgi:hypothetical protein